MAFRLKFHRKAQPEPPSPGAPPERLSCWKEIANYLGREVRTVQRWEKSEGLPVRRLYHSERGSVFAERQELDDWLAKRIATPSGEAPCSAYIPVSSSSRRHIPIFVFVTILVFAAGVLMMTRPRRSRPHIPAATAQAAYLRGVYYLNRGTYQDLMESGRYFQKAIQADPSFAQAYAGYSEVRLLTGGATGDIAASRDYAKRAVALGPDVAETHVALAMLLAYADWNWMAAEREFQKALRLNPKLASAHDGYAQLEGLIGREALAVSETTRARQLEPLSATIGSNLAWDLYWARRYDDAITASREVLKAEPGFSIARNCTVRALLAQGRMDEARAELVAQVRESGGDPAAYGLNASVPSVAVRNYIERHLDNQWRLFAESRTDTFMIAIDLAVLHRKKELIDCLEQALARRESVVLVMNVEPLFDPYRDDPRFVRIARATGLPAATEQTGSITLIDKFQQFARELIRVRNPGHPSAGGPCQHSMPLRNSFTFSKA